MLRLQFLGAQGEGWMRRREFLVLAGASATFPRAAFAQQSAKQPRIVYIHTQPDLRDPFAEGLANIGHIDRRNCPNDYSIVPTKADVTGDVTRAVAIHANPDA